MKIRRTGIPRPTDGTMLPTVRAVVEVVDELQGAVGTAEQRAVRLGELLRAGVVKFAATGELVAGESTGDGEPGSPGPQGPVGPEGPEGPAGSADLDLAHPASGPLTSSRAAALDGTGRATYPDRTDPNDAPRVLGVLLTSASAIDDLVTIRRRGTISELAWAWALGPIWVGDTGLLTQTAPETGWLLQIGVAIDTNTVDIDPQPPIYL